MLSIIAFLLALWTRPDAIFGPTSQETIRTFKFLIHDSHLNTGMKIHVDYRCSKDLLICVHLLILAILLPMLHFVYLQALPAREVRIFITINSLICAFFSAYCFLIYTYDYPYSAEIALFLLGHAIAVFVNNTIAVSVLVFYTLGMMFACAILDPENWVLFGVFIELTIVSSFFFIVLSPTRPSLDFVITSFTVGAMVTCCLFISSARLKIYVGLYEINRRISFRPHEEILKVLYTRLVEWLVELHNLVVYLYNLYEDVPALVGVSMFLLALVFFIFLVRYYLK